MPDDLSDYVPSTTLPASAGRAAGWGMLAVFGLLGAILWYRRRR